MSICSSAGWSELQSVDHSSQCVRRMSERSDARDRYPRILPRATAWNREWIRDPECDEAFVSQSIERGVDRAERGRPFRSLLELAFDRDGVGVVAESLECGEHENFELAEEVAFGHA
jgi:hypothetical protein